jgi:hypothetical protein
MASHPVVEMAQQGQPKAIAALLAKSLESYQPKVQVGFREEVLVVKVTSERTLDQSQVVARVQTVLARLASPQVGQCSIEAFSSEVNEPLWTEQIDLAADAVNGEASNLQVPDLAAEGEDVGTTTIEADAPPITEAQPKVSGWKFPGVSLGSLQKVGSQVADQAFKAAHETAQTTQGAAAKATEQALRSSIDQTMNAFQIAVEQIHARKLPAKMTALTGTINVGVIQLSIRLDIPMDEETGEIVAEAQTP